jgi:hypothetical protein
MNDKYMSHILENDEEYPIAEVPQPTAARRLGDVEKIMFQTALNQLNATTLAYEAEKLPFFTFVLSHLSENSKTILMRDEHYVKQRCFELMAVNNQYSFCYDKYFSNQ